jgi:phospholipase C
MFLNGRRKRGISSAAKFMILAGVIIAAAVGYFAYTIFFMNQMGGSGTSSPIKHIIVIMQENRSFDHYFGTYPGANGLPAGTCVPENPSVVGSPCVKPFLLTTPITTDLPHTYNATIKAINGGQMNGFYAAEGSCTQTMGYYDQTMIPYYWNYAQHFVLSDGTFESANSYSLPNHWYMIAAQAPQIGYYQYGNNGFGVNTPKPVLVQYVSEANQIQTLGDSMIQSGISWKYYDSPMDPKGIANAIVNGQVAAYWNTFRAKNSSYTSEYMPHFVFRGQLLSDIGNGTLPSVSWVIPSAPVSEHAPANLTLGMWYVRYLVNAVMNSNYWKDTAIIISWDDYGGWYDHVAPPVIDQFGYGIRVPMLIISPYSKPGFIDNTVYSFDSILKFVEWNFGLHSLTSRDANANNLLNAFNFQQTPLGPDIIPLNQSQISQITPYLWKEGGQIHTPVGSSCNSQSVTGYTISTNQSDDDYSAFINNNPD